LNGSPVPTKLETLLEFLSELIKNQAFLLIILGVLIFVVSAAGGISHWQFVIPQGPWQYASAVVGLSLAGAGAAMTRWSASSVSIDAKKFGFKISIPVHKDPVAMQDMHYVVSGTYKKRPPENYVPYIVEIEYHDNEIKYRPRKLAVIEDTGWHAKGVWGGDKPNIERTIVVALVGAGGQAQFKYYDTVGKTYNYDRRPPIDTLGPDIYVCDRIRFTTGTNHSQNTSAAAAGHAASGPPLPSARNPSNRQGQFEQINEKIVQTTEATITSAILSTEYKFVFNPLNNRSKTLSFLRDGSIGQGRNNNEASWRVTNGKLEILNSEGELYSRFALQPDGLSLQHTNDLDTQSIKGQFLVPIK
jgi:hypothetical protein